MKLKHKRCLSAIIVLTMMLMLGSNFAQNVYAESTSTTISSSSTHRTVATSTTTATSRRDTTKSCGSIEHVYGNPTNIIMREIAATVRASDPLGAPQYTSYFAPHTSILGLSYEDDITGSNLPVEIGPNNSSRIYYLYPTWSCQRLVQQVVTTYSGGSRIDYTRTVAYVPFTGSKITELTWRP